MLGRAIRELVNIDEADLVVHAVPSGGMRIDTDYLLLCP
jgi:hypothetical protein